MEMRCFVHHLQKQPTTAYTATIAILRAERNMQVSKQLRNQLRLSDFQRSRMKPSQGMLSWAIRLPRQSWAGFTEKQTRLTGQDSA
jgi:hypothetical protein